MWVAMPCSGLLLTYFSHKLVRKHIFENKNARRRIIVFIPYYITFCGYIMFIMSVTKNFNQYSKNQHQLNYWAYFVPIIVCPFILLIISRFFMLRRGRDLNKISIENVASKLIKKSVSTKCPDFLSALKIWDNKPIL